jgi:sulfane dehydrogenase subunit SoxC
LLGGLAAGLLASAAASTARAEAPAAPHVPDDATRVLGGPSTPTGERSPFEARAIAPTGVITGASFCPLQDLVGTITPTDLQFQRHHGGIAQIDPARWRLLVHGLVDRQLVFTLADLKRFPPSTRVHFLECAGNGRAAYRDPTPQLTPQTIDGLTSNLEWTGVPLSLVLAEVGVRPEARWLLAEGGDAAVLARSFPLEKALDDAMLVYAANGEPLRPANGYPVRLLLPGWEGNMCIKWLRRLEVKTGPTMTKDETAKYTDPLPGDRARRFSFVLDAKSIITHPAHPAVLSAPGWWPVTGLAWSGRGRITRVEVSTDGGRSWADAHLDGPASPKTHVRFLHPWRWRGDAAVLMSRATDETGYVQPTLAEFRRVRGAGTDYHFNFIRAWRVETDGRVFYVPDPESA